MNKIWYFVIAIGLVLVILISGYVVMSIGTKLDVELVGIRYRLGEDNIKYEESVTLKFEGRYVNSFFKRSFIGDIYINSYKLNKINNSKTQITFNEHNSAQLYDTNHNNDIILTDRIYINDDFTKVAICVGESFDEDSTSKSWNSSTGLIIAAPASNREQALMVSNEVMNAFIQKDLK